MTRNETLRETLTSLCAELREGGRTMRHVFVHEIVDDCCFGDATNREIARALRGVPAEYEYERGVLGLYLFGWRYLGR
jgi:hypothetical protein